MKKGKITISYPSHGWGTIQSESGDGFIFYFRDMPKGTQLTKGQDVQFTPERCGSHGFKALNISVLDLQSQETVATNKQN